MAQEKIASGVLMKNDRKEEGDKRPDYTGPATVIVAGAEVEYDIAAWVTTATKDSARLKTGDKYMSWTIQEKWKADVAAEAEAGKVATDDIAF